MASGNVQAPRFLGSRRPLFWTKSGGLPPANLGGLPRYRFFFFLHFFFLADSAERLCFFFLHFFFLTAWGG